MDSEVVFGPTVDLLTEGSLTGMYRVPVLTTPVAFSAGARPVVAPDLLGEGVR